MAGKIRASLGLAFSILTFPAIGGCGRKAPPEPRRYCSREKGFSLKLPENWERKEGLMGTTIVALSPKEGPGDGFRENINVYVEDLPKAISVEEYAEITLANMRKIMTDLAEEDKGAVETGGASCYRLVYAHRMGQLDIKVLQYLAVKGRRGYAITCSAAPDSFLDYSDAFEDVVASFRFE